MENTSNNLPSIKPYMIRAWHEWCSENGYTPYIVVAVDENVEVPQEHIQNGLITLNASWDATGNLQLGNEVIRFQARFSGRVRDIVIPVERIQAIYARENGAGMGFEVEEVASSAPASTITPPAQEKARSTERGAGLAIVKKSSAHSSPARTEAIAERQTTLTPVAIKKKTSASDGDGEPADAKPSSKGSGLRVVK